DDVDATATRFEQLGGAVHVPPQNIPNVSRFSVGVDPQKATIALLKWSTGQQESAIRLDAPGRIGWQELIAAECERAWTCYRELFGWEKAQANVGAWGIYQLFSAGGQIIGGMFTKPETAPLPFWLYYFNVGDIDAAMKRVRASGGEVVNGPLEVS